MEIMEIMEITERMLHVSTGIHQKKMKTLNLCKSR